MELLALYEAILRALNFKVTEEGLLTYVFDGIEIPATVDDKRMTLPTRDVLRSGNWEGRIAFHPLSENLLRGESPVLRQIKKVANHRLSSIITDLLIQLATLGFDTSKHKLLPPKAADVLSAMPGIDEKFVETLKKILNRQDDQSANRLISIYLKRGGTFRGQKAARVAVVSFPILEQIEREEDVFGVKMRKKDLIILDGLFKYILPDSDDLETYSAPSQSMSAPYFDALMRAYYNVCDRLNTVVKLQWKMLENPEELLTELDWIDSLKDLSVYDGAIPALSGNEGDVTGQEEAAPAMIPATVSHAANLFKVGAPTAPTAPAIEAKDDDVPWRTDEKETLSKPKSPFHTENVSKVLHSPSNLFQVNPAATAGPLGVGSGADPNKFDRPTEGGRSKDDYAAWVARHSPQVAAPVQQVMPVHPGYGAPPPGYGPPPPGYGPPPGYPIQPPQGPAWMVPAQPTQVAPGEYAGRVRGVPVTNYGYGNASTPNWLNPVNAPQPGYGNPGPGYGGGYGGSNAL